MHKAENFACDISIAFSTTHCLLVLGSDTEDGVLINSEGYNYARYSAYIPNIRQSVTLEQFPALESFNKRMINVTNSIMNQAIEAVKNRAIPNTELILTNTTESENLPCILH